MWIAHAAKSDHVIISPIPMRSETCQSQRYCKSSGNSGGSSALIAAGAPDSAAFSRCVRSGMPSVPGTESLASCFAYSMSSARLS